MPVRDQPISIGGVATLTVAALAGNAFGAPLALVKAGRAQATVVVDSSRYPRTEDLTNKWQTLERTIRNVADTVVDYVRKSTGADVPVVDRNVVPLPADGVLLHIGRSEYVDGLMDDELSGIDKTGYIIRAVDGRNLVVAGQAPEGTEFGTYEFLERFVRVRWLMPTELGEHVPKHADLTVPRDTNVVDEPAFMQVPGIAFMPTHKAWARKMRFWSRLNFHHSLVKLFAPEVYGETHPEFYPLKNPDDAKRYVPSGKCGRRWRSIRSLCSPGLAVTRTSPRCGSRSWMPGRPS